MVRLIMLEKGCKDRAYTSHGHGVHRPALKNRIVIYPAVSENDAFETEIALIWYYGRKDLGLGSLRNLTDGGENPPIGANKGRKHNAYTKEILSKKVKELWEDPAYAENMSKAHMGQQAWNKGKKHSEKHIANLKIAQAAAHKNPNRKLKEWKHGTKTGYANHKCRCEACVQWYLDYYQKRKQILKNGKSF